MKFALIAFGTFVFASCTNTLYTHRKDFEPSKRKGPWADYEKAVRSGDDPAETVKLPDAEKK